jgi:hypothetical protein
MHRTILSFAWQPAPESRYLASLSLINILKLMSTIILTRNRTQNSVKCTLIPYSKEIFITRSDKYRNGASRQSRRLPGVIAETEEDESSNVPRHWSYEKPQNKSGQDVKQ